MHGVEEGRLEDVLNPADSLMIPLCECTRSCVLSFLSELKYVFILTLHLAFVHMLWLFYVVVAVGVGANGSAGFREKTLWRACFTPPPPTPQIHSISSPYPSGSTAAQRITKRGLAVTSHWRDGWARVWGRVSTWVCVRVRWVWALCVCSRLIRRWGWLWEGSED